MRGIMGPFQYVVTGREMTEYDRNTIEEFKVPALILIEQAALAVTEEITERFPGGKERVLVLAGSGNNGGDAMAVARLLMQRGFEVTLFWVSEKEPEDLGQTALCQYRMLEKMQIKTVTGLPEETYAIVVDGIFGVGLSRLVSERIGRILETVSGWEAYRVAIDIPSGVDSNTGKILGYGFRADCTITFSFLKLGLVLYPGAAYAGQIKVKEIGITESSFGHRPPAWIALTGKATDHIPCRPENGHKGTFGKVLVIAGNETSGGAAFLSALGAFRTGCGMVCICTHRSQHSALLSLLPEAMFGLYENEREAEEVLAEKLAWADVILLGPALGCGKTAEVLLKRAITDSRQPLLVDADGLTLLSTTALGEELKKRQHSSETGRELIFTPHPAELSRLADCSLKEATDREKEVLEKTASAWKAVIAGKDARTLVVDPEGGRCINLSGNSGMATAGSGDLLAGMIASLLAQGMKPFEAAASGVYLHAMAGDYVARQNNEYTLMASDLADALKKLLNKNKESSTKI